MKNSMKKAMVILVAMVLVFSTLSTTALAGDNLTQNVVTLDAAGNPMTGVDGGTISVTEGSTFGVKYWEVTAHAKSDYEFDHWEGDIIWGATTNPNHVFRYGSKSVTAVFRQIPRYTLTVNIVGQGSANVASGTTFVEDTKVYLSANAASGWEFDHWEGVDSHTGDRDPHVHMTANRTVTAYFTEIPRYTLTINTVGQGTVDTNPSGSTFFRDTKVYLTANAASGWAFDHWEGVDSHTGDRDPHVHMTGNKTVTAVFKQLFSLTISTQGNGRFIHADHLDSTYMDGATVNLMDAAPYPNDIIHYYFAGWRDNSNPGAPLLKPPTYIPELQTYLGSVNITMNQNQSYTAVFTGFDTKIYTSVKADAYGNYNGVLDNDLNGHEYPFGSDVDLDTAQPRETTTGYEFKYWEEKIGSLGNYSWVRTSSTISVGVLNEYRAVFGLKDYTLTVNSAHGSISPTLAGTYQHGTVITLSNYSVTSDSEYNFVRWEDENGNPISSVTMDGSKTITAVYDINEYDLTVNTAHGSVDASLAGSYDYGTVIDLTSVSTTPDTGYHFVRWEDENGSTISSVTINGNRTINAVFEMNKYDVTFKVGAHGTWMDDSTADQIVPTQHGSIPDDPDVKPETGWHFDGWAPTLEAATGTKSYTAQYSQIDYTLTIDYVDRASGSAVATQYTHTYHYNDSYNVTSPAVLGYDLPSIVTVSGTMPDHSDVITVYYDAHVLALQYVQGSGDVPMDTRQYIVFTRDSVNTTYPVLIGYRIGTSGPIISLGNLAFTNKKSNPITFTSGNTIGVENTERCRLYWYDTDNTQWVQARSRLSEPLHQVTFDANGGAYSDLSVLKYDYAYKNGNVSAPGQPTKLGHTFAGWDINNDDSLDAADDVNSDGVYDALDVAAVNVVASMTISAQYTIDQHTLAVNTANGSVDPTLPGTYNYGTVVLLTNDLAYPNMGYHFVEWQDAGGNPITSVLIDGDKTISAVFAINTYTVTFADYDGTVLKTQVVDWNTAATAPDDPSREGYTFTGWDQAFNAVKSDLTVKAEYSINTFTVKFYEQDGVTQIGTTQTINWDAAATFETAPAIEGHAFDQWILTGDNDQVDTSLTHVKENVIAIASYIRNGYTVTFVDYNGAVIGTDGVLYGEAATAPVPPTRIGYTFTGWDQAFDSVTSNLTVTAQYRINTYRVSFVDYNGTSLKTQTVNWGAAATAPDDPSRDGYTFTGWDRTFGSVTSNMTVTAEYTVNTYTVTFTDYDGTVLKTQVVDWNTAAAAPDDPSREGYTFTGWDQAFNAVTSDITITAQYEQIETLLTEEVPQTSDVVTLGDEEIPQSGTGVFPWWWIPIGLGILGLIFLLLLLLLKRRKEENNNA